MWSTLSAPHSRQPRAKKNESKGMNVSGSRFRERCAAVALGIVVVAVACGPGAPAVRAAEPTAQPAAAEAPAVPSTARVVRIENVDPCSQKAARQAAFGKAIGGGLLGAALGAAGEAIRILIVNSGKKDGEKKAKGNYALAAGLGAVLGAAIGYHRGLDSARRQCEIYKLAQQRALDAQFEQIALLPVADTATIDPLPLPQLEAPPEAPEDAKPKSKSKSKPAPKAKPSKPKPEYDEKDLVYASVTTFPEANSFATGSATLRPEARAHFVEIARQYSPAGQEQSARETYRSQSEQYRKQISEDDEITGLRAEWAKLRIVLVGHTDDTGDSAANAKLSEARARSVAQLFREEGVPVEQLYYQGAGSSLPVADNRTEEGRAKNRRVEVIELPAGADVAQYLSLRRANPAFNRPLPQFVVPAEAVVAAKPRAPAPQPTLAGAPATKPAPAPTAPPAKSASTGDWVAAPAPKPSATPPKPASPSAKPATSPPKSASADIWTPAPAQAPKPASAPPKPAKRPPAAAQAQATLPPLGVDFGGRPVDEGARPVASLIGGPRERRGGWGFISTAVASGDTLFDTPCTQDSPQLNVGLPVKQLAGDAPVHRTNEYLPGLYDTAWKGIVNGHALALLHVAVLRDGSEPVADPDVLVYRDFDPTALRTADLKLRGKVKVYEGTQGLLYRVFVERSRLRCIDVVLPYGGGTAAKAGAMYYDDRTRLLTADYVPAMETRTAGGTTN